MSEKMAAKHEEIKNKTIYISALSTPKHFGTTKEYYIHYLLRAFEIMRK